MIKSGDEIPDIPIWLANGDLAGETSSSSLFGDGRSILVTLPGAFTPTCHNNHLPGFIKNAPSFRDLGISRIACACVNDRYVMRAWAEQLGDTGEIDFLSDFDASFARSLGLDRDFSASGLGVRFIRCAMIIVDGVVQDLFLDEVRGRVAGTGAAHVLGVLRSGSPSSSLAKEICEV